MNMLKQIIKNAAKKSKLVWILLDVYYAIRSKRESIRSVRRMKRIAQRQRKGQLLRVGFIVQLSGLWDKQKAIYEEVMRRDNMEAFLFVVPDYDQRTHSLKQGLEDNYFLANYPEAIPAVDQFGNVIDLKAYQLDYLFYPRPYDIYLPRGLSSFRMMKNTKCCYVPYAFLGADVFNGLNTKSSFFEHIYFCFMDSAYTQRLMKAAHNNPYQRIEYFGYPCLDQYLSMKATGATNTVTWAPRWSYDKNFGGSNFLEYKDHFTALFQESECQFIFRPHPLMFDELINKHLMDEQEKDTYLSQLDAAKVIFDVSSPIDDILEKTDVLISDFSSIIGSYFLTGRPIIYCDKGIELNEVFREMAKYMYIAHDWEEVSRYYTQIVVERRDPLFKERTAFIRSAYGEPGNAAARIVDALEAG